MRLNLSIAPSLGSHLSSNIETRSGHAKTIDLIAHIAPAPMQQVLDVPQRQREPRYIITAN